MEIDLSAAWTATLGMAQGLIRLLPKLVVGALVFVAILFLSKWISKIVRSITGRYQRSRSVGLVLGRMAQWIAIFIGLLIALSIVLPSFQASSLIELLGIGGVAVGFAFRDIFQNFLAGILLLLTEPFKIGDQIIVDSYEGTVEDIKTRATLIRTYDGRRVVIPNSDLFTKSVTVNTAYGNRMTEYEFSIRSADDLAVAQRAVLDAVREVPGVLSDPGPDTLVVSMSDSSINVRVRWWTAPTLAEVLEVKNHVIAAIKKNLDALHKDVRTSAGGANPDPNNVTPDVAHSSPVVPDRSKPSPDRDKKDW